MLSGTPAQQVSEHGDRKRIHKTWEDKECIEEFDKKSGALILRKWRHKTVIGSFGPWEVEVGEMDRTVITGSSTMAGSDLLLKENSKNPFLVRKDTKSHFVWRIRNMIWPKETYQVSIQDNRIYVRTTNKKYFKILNIPDLDRLKHNLDPSQLYHEYGADTLMICYRKPSEVVQMEQASLKLEPSKQEDEKCPQQ
ncbi:DPCD protein family-domain-containing protein [Gorgonomyces haynaldii]|nr:DPCD protein family-domain-containing protein [Gorgonomyces haynaldii]